jgi:hypothetical protein
MEGIDVSQDNPTGPPTASVQAKIKSGAGFTWKHVATTLVVASAVVAVLITWLIMRAPGEVGQQARSVVAEIGEAIKGAYITTDTTTIHSAISEISKKAKLVVLTPDLTVEVTKSKETKALGVYFGTTTSTVRAFKNRCQYYVAVGSITVASFTFDPEHKILTLRSPMPLFDEEMVVVQSDPKLMEVRTEAGWASIKSGEGKRVEEEAKAALKGAVIEEGKKDQYQAMAREEFRKVITSLLETSMRGVLRPEVKVEVEWDSSDKKSN